MGRPGKVTKLTAAAVAAAALAAAGLFALRWAARERAESLRYERQETELTVSNLAGARLRLFRAGRSPQDAVEVPDFGAMHGWLPPGNYFLAAAGTGRILFYPVPLLGYRGGPDRDGAFTVTIRPPPASPPLLPESTSEFVYIPSGYSLIGDRLNPREPHYVWLTAFFISAWEVTNAEFRRFLRDPDGYAEAQNWSEDGWRWRTAHPTSAAAQLKPWDAEYKRFGQPDQPVVLVNWFEANAYCRWLTRKLGRERWIFSLPADAEWEKAARGPDSFDYGLGMAISDAEVGLYNWKKNPDVAVTVAGVADSRSVYKPNRYGLYHASGNVAEWTQSVFRHYNQQAPYEDDDRNHDGTPGRRSVRGGSWYSATSAPLYLPYRDSFQPEHAGNDLGFRVVARMRP